MEYRPPKMKSLLLSSLLSLLFFAGASGVVYKCEHEHAVEETHNPIGTCAAEGHLWIKHKCLEGFLCKDTTGAGCHIVCPDGMYLYANMELEFWDCVEPGRIAELEAEHSSSTGSKDDLMEIESEDGEAEPRFIYCPIDGYNVFTEYDPENTPAPIPPEEVTENPIGTCHCDGEFWLEAGCKYAFLCDSEVEHGGHYIHCPNAGEVLDIDFETREWTCTTNLDVCPGGAIEGAGCQMPNCNPGNNHLGTCECDGQLFIDDACSEGFLCTNNIDDPFLYDGCVQRCAAGQVLRPDFAQKSWECVPEEQAPICPGQYHLECPENPIPHGINSSFCDCGLGELIMTGDCKEAFYCHPLLPNGGRTIECTEPDEIVVLDVEAWDWDCSSVNPDQCPGLGGVKVGCSGGNISPPPLTCEDADFTTNPLGTCDGCEGQIFINANCSESFYCSQYTPDETSEGCHLVCPEGEHVMVDLINKDWGCVPYELNPSFFCPGTFSVDCPDHTDYRIDCACRNEIWLSDDCTQAFMCNGPAENGVNDGTAFTCPADRPIIVPDFSFGGRASCTDDPTQCPGSYHFGCKGGDNPALDTTTEMWMTSSTTTTTTTSATGRVAAESALVTLITAWLFTLTGMVRSTAV